MLYVIGGPPQSGKSLIRRELLDKMRLSGIDTDILRSMFQTDKDLRKQIHYLNTQTENAVGMESFLAGFIDEFVNYRDEDYVLEGDVITVSLASKYIKNRNKVKFIFIGYPDISVVEKLQIIRSKEGEKCWTRAIDDEKLKEKIVGWVKRSNILQKECTRNNVPFFDLSDPGVFSKKIKELVSTIKKTNTT